MKKQGVNCLIFLQNLNIFCLNLCSDRWITR